MQTIWHIKGDKAGSFEQVEDDMVKSLVGSGQAQVADGVTPLSYPQGHPHYEEAAPKKTRAKRKYPNKMMKTNESDQSS